MARPDCSFAFIALIFATTVAMGCLAPSGGIAPDTIWLNGTIVTMEGDQTAQAVAVLDDNIVAVGTDADVGPLA